MSLGCARYHLYPDECNNRYRLHKDGSRSACVHQDNGCVEEADHQSIPPAPPTAHEPPSPPFVQVVHPATASTQIVLADTFQTAPPGRRTYRPLQYLTQNGYPETPGANVTNAMIDANIVLCAQGECTKLICATSCDESIGKISPECKSITWMPSLQACDYHADNHTAPAGFDDMGREYYVSSPAEEGYINVQLTITDPQHLNVMVDANGNRGAMRPIFVMDAEPNAHGGALAWRGTFTTGGDSGNNANRCGATGEPYDALYYTQVGCRYTDGSGDSPAGNDYPYNVARNVVAKGVYYFGVRATSNPDGFTGNEHDFYAHIGRPPDIIEHQLYQDTLIEITLTIGDPDNNYEELPSAQWQWTIHS